MRNAAAHRAAIAVKELAEYKVENFLKVPNERLFLELNKTDLRLLKTHYPGYMKSFGEIRECRYGHKRIIGLLPAMKWDHIASDELDNEVEDITPSKGCLITFVGIVLCMISLFPALIFNNSWLLLLVIIPWLFTSYLLLR